ncbi:MAG TPA: histidine utilization repressor [Steroidobacteraceae bacterium]|jgi:GntR family histidine utilization transcriptional repressor|nr:histidine utilization repressor [Steroidobacteraceae bacterium]
MSPPGNADDRPGALYEQVKRHIVERIRSGEWVSGARVPSENELVQLLGVSRMTVHRALRELSSQGLLARVQGVGTFVAPAHAKSELLEVRDIGDDVVARGHEHSVKVVAQDAVRASPDMAVMFDLRPGAKVFHSLLVHFEDELPIQQEERFVRPSFAPSYLEQDFTRQTPGNYLLSIALPTELDHVVFAVLPDKRAQRLLKVGATEPCLMLTRRTWVTAVPVTRSSFIYPGSRHSLGSRHKL